jgi:hypothetical protein
MHRKCTVGHGDRTLANSLDRVVAGYDGIVAAKCNLHACYNVKALGKRLARTAKFFSI